MVKYLCCLCENEVYSENVNFSPGVYTDLMGVEVNLELHFCHICIHLLEKFKRFKSECMKRLNYLDYIYLKEDSNRYLEHGKIHDYRITETDLIDINEDFSKSDNDFEESNDISDDLVAPDINNYEDIQEPENSLNKIVLDHKGPTEPAVEEHVKKKSKKKKRVFKKIILSYEEQKSVLEAQRKDKKYIEAEFKCYSCAQGFLFKDSYQSHMVRHEESNGQYSCNVCGLRFATQNVCCMHYALHAERYRCYKCNEFVKRPHRRKHMNACWNQNKDPVSCHQCGKVFKDSSGLQQHLKRFHMAKTNKRIYSCNICAKNYNNQSAVRTHMIKHTNRRFNCDMCESTFSSPYTLIQHKKSHTNLNQAYCETCNTWYKTKKLLQAHLRNSQKHQRFSYDCPVCGRSCPTRRSVESHMQTIHSADKPFICQDCPARYTSKSSLVRHMKIHKRYKPTPEVVCHLCGKSYRGKSKLNRHLKDVCERKLDEDYIADFDNSILM